MSKPLIDGLLARCEINVDDFRTPFKDQSGKTLSIPAGNDIVVQGLFRTVGVIPDISTISTLNAAILVADRSGNPFASVTLGAVDLDNTVDEGTWADGTKQHFQLTFSAADTELPGTVDGTEYFLVFYGTLVNTKTRDFGWTKLTIIRDGVPGTGVVVRQPANIVGEGAAYDGSGNYSLPTEVGRPYRWTKGAHDTNVGNGMETVTVSNSIFYAQGATTILTGTAGQPVTAVVWYPTIPTLDEVRALVTSIGNTVFANGLWLPSISGNLYYRVKLNDAGGFPVLNIDPTSGTASPS